MWLCKKKLRKPDQNIILLLKISPSGFKKNIQESSEIRQKIEYFMKNLKIYKINKIKMLDVKNSIIEINNK